MTDIEIIKQARQAIVLVERARCAKPNNFTYRTVKALLAEVDRLAARVGELEATRDSERDRCIKRIRDAPAMMGGLDDQFRSGIKYAIRCLETMRPLPPPPETNDDQ